MFLQDQRHFSLGIMNMDLCLIYVVFLSCCLLNSVISDDIQDEPRYSKLDQTESESRQKPSLDQLKQHMLKQLERMENVEMKKKIEGNIRNLSDKELMDRMKQTRKATDNQRDDRKKHAHTLQDDFESEDIKDRLHLKRQKEMIKKHIQDQKMRAAKLQSELKDEL